MVHNRKWVFTELVRDANDPSQLIAYAIYKADKDDMANSMRVDHKTELEIQAALDAFHDSVASTPRLLANYRQKSETVITSLVVNIANDTEAKLNKQIDKIKAENASALAKEGKKAVEEYHKKIKQSTASKQTKLGWLGEFTISGFSGVWATLLVISLVYIISMATATDNDRNRVTDSFFGRMKTFFTSSPIPEAGDSGSSNQAQIKMDTTPKP